MRVEAPRDGVTVDLDGVDLLDGDLYAAGDPHSIWHVMRDRAPVWRQRLRDGREFFSVTRYADVSTVLRDHTTFTSERGTLLSALGLGDPAGGRMMAATDPPRHTALREGLNRALSARNVAARAHELKVPVDRVLAPFRAGADHDLAVAAADFPMNFIGAFMGLPEDDWPRLTRLTTMAIAPDDPAFRIGESERLTLATAHHELFQYFSREVAARRGVPSDDLIGLLIGLTIDGDRLTHDDIVYNCYSLILGANVTTPHTLTATIQALIDRPGSFRRVAADPELVRGCVEEGLRWSSPANHFMRHATRDVELNGTRIPKGAAVAAWLGSANRDERVFDRPYEFDVDRRPNPHIAFGYGPHFCVGAALARLSLGMLFAEIFATVDRFEPTGDVEHLASNFVAGIKSMPVRAVPAANRNRGSR